MATLRDEIKRLKMVAGAERRRRGDGPGLGDTGEGRGRERFRKASEIDEHETLAFAYPKIARYARATSGGAEMNVNQAQIFEDEVRRIARILWPSPRFQGSQIIESRERDGYFETDDAIHVVEATTDRRKAKAEEDCKKTSQLVSDLRKIHKDKAVKGWLVLRNEPTADQNAVAKQYARTVTVVPYSKFISRIVDAPGYLNSRSNCPFGSATDPFDNNHSVPRDTFVEPYLANKSTNKNIDFRDFCEISSQPSARTIILGDFGAGKSMSLREFYFLQAEQYLSGNTSRFPVYLNLRSHQGQGEPIEALIRHAKFVGYQPGEDLIKAWRADLTTIILDGFDELVTPA